MVLMVRLPKLPKIPLSPGRHAVEYESLAHLKEEMPYYGVQEKRGKPATFHGSDLEWFVYDWLTRQHIPFDYQVPYLGGRFSKGGQIIDFVLLGTIPRILLGVQGEWWHYRNTQQGAISQLAKLSLQRGGDIVVYLRENDLRARLDYTMREAVKGHQLFQD